MTRSGLPSARFVLWLTGALLLTVLLRAPWLGTPLGNDEGGLAFIAGAGRGGGPFMYGDYFIDRPPLLLAVFRLAAETSGTATVRTIGVLAALAGVTITALLARAIAGARAARFAGVLAAILMSSVALGSVFTPAELLAVLPSTLSVLLVWRGTRDAAGRPGLLFAAGFLAISALLVKQSFGDALLAGVACLTATCLWHGSPRREVGLAAGAYAGGIVAAIVGVEAWEYVAAVPDGSMSYALLGFRLDGLGALAGSGAGLPGRFAQRLLVPLICSGFAVVLIWSVAGLRSARADRVLIATLGAWGVGGSLGVLGGGSYWAHYLIQLIPFVAVTASIALAGASARRARATVAVLGACAVGGLVIGPLATTDEKSSAAAIGQALAASARAGDTAHVLYSQADVLYYSGLADPFPYQWSLMMRAVPDARTELRALLSSPGRPTWIVEWERPAAYGLDRSGATARLLDRHYRHISNACGVRVLIEKDTARAFHAPSPQACGQGTLLARGGAQPPPGAARSDALAVRSATP